jgi:hypothetical protein
MPHTELACGSELGRAWWRCEARGAWPRLTRWRVAAAAASAIAAAAVAVTITRPAPEPRPAIWPAPAHRPSLAGSHGGAPVGAWLADCPTVPGSQADSCGAWSGYDAQNVSTQIVSAQFEVPDVSCGNLDGFEGFWAGVQGTATNGAVAIVQPGVQAVCVNGQPTYSAFTVAPGPTANDSSPGYPTPLQEPVQPGDLLWLAAVRWGGPGDWVQLIWNETENWVQDIPVSGGPVTVSDTAVAGESALGGVISGTTAVTNAQINFAPIGQYNPQASVQNPASYYQGPPGGILPSALLPTPLDSSGQNFSIGWVPAPGA